MDGRIAAALDHCTANLGWSNAKIAGEIEVSEQSVRNYRARRGEPSASVYQRMRERVPGFADFVDSSDGKAVA